MLALISDDASGRRLSGKEENKIESLCSLGTQAFLLLTDFAHLPLSPMGAAAG